MFRYLLNRKISTRIGLTIALPLIALLAVLVSLVIEKSQLSRSMNDLRNLAQLAPTISATVHELQKERGVSAGYVSSKGKKFSRQLTSQINKSNEKLTALEIAFAIYDLTLHGGGLSKKVELARSSFSQLPIKRQEFRGLGKTVNQVTDFYTPAIAQLLSIIEEMAVVSHDKQITSMVTGYTNFLQGKERAGLERAMGSVGFSAGKFSPPVIKKFTELIAQQDTYFGVFKNYATREQRSIYPRIVSGPVLHEVERMRIIAFDNPYTNMTKGISGPLWFEAITKKIDLLKKVEDRIATDLITLTNAKLEEAKNYEVLYAVLTFIIFVLTGGLAYTLSRGITRPLDEAAEILAKLSAGDSNVEISTFERRGEIGKIFSGLENFKLAASDLKKSEDSKSSIFMGALDAIISVNLKGEIIEFNPSAEAMFGFSNDTVIGKDIADLILPDELRERHRIGFARYVETRESTVMGKRLELTALHLDGSRFDIELSLTHSGDSDRITAFIQDITDRKKAQEAIENSRDELEIRVQERTEELEKARELADAANLAKSDFLSAMSHELRTPMNAILGFGQFLMHNQKEPLSEDQNESVNHILKGGEHLLDLINDVLDLSKIEAGKIEVSIEDVSLQDVMVECISVAENLNENIAVKASSNCLEGNPYIVRGDVTRLKQVLLNLLSNAVKYNRENGSVNVDCEEIEGHKLRISVSDTGMGIPKEKQELLFEPFNRLGAEVTEIEGTGIGLSITKRLIELMEGEIGFKSEVGVGSSFWIDVQLAGSQPFNQQEIDQAKDYQWRDDAVDVEGSRVMLYVEDNPMNLALMEKIIGQFPNLILRSAHTAELGIAIAVQEMPDLIVMDVNLPGMDGIVATKELKLNEHTKHIPVIGLSARALPRDIKKGMDAGFERYITKPMVIAEMIEAISEILGAQPENVADNIAH